MKRTKIGLILAAAAAGFTVGVAAFGFAAAPAAPDPSQTDINEAKSGTTPDGRTFGVAGSDISASPDLIAVYATNGELGYVELDSYLRAMAPASTLDEALTMSERRDAIVLPVFGTDGATVIGEFHVTFEVAQSER